MRRVIAGTRILLTTDAVGGVWTYTLDLAAGLRAAGATVRIAVLGPAPTAQQRAEAAGLDIQPLGQTLEWLAAVPGEVAAAATAIVEAAQAWRADLVHLHSPAYAVAAFPCPSIAVHHSCGATWWAAVRAGALPADLVWRAAAVGEGLRRADAVLAPSRAHAAAVARCYDLPVAPTVVHNGRAPAPPATVAECAEIVTTGRLWDEGKNIALLDRAAPSLPWPVRAVGPVEGPNGARVSLPNLHVLGARPQSEVRRMLAGRPIYVSPARYEPFGLAVLEAAQAGCPLVLADIPVFRELWDGAAAFVDPDDAAALANAVLTLTGSGEQRRECGAAAQRRAASYTLEAMVAGTVAACVGVLGARSTLRRGASAA